MGNRAAIYLRVSKGERHTENQRPDIDRVIATRRLELVAQYKGSWPHPYRKLR